MQDLILRNKTACAFVAGVVLTGAAFWAFSYVPLDARIAGIAYYPEIAALAGTAWTFQEYSTYFQNLGEKKGAVYMYDVLKRAPFPPNIDLHLLGHLAGNLLYKEYGKDAIRLCTPDFRNACSHSVVIGILTDHGEGVLPEIATICKQAPGGKGAYGMCFHGLGHGVLAYVGYDLEQAVRMCKIVGTPEYRDREYIECVGGTVMEMIGGVHDPIAWQAQREKYFKKSDPLYPCNAAFMPDIVKNVCYTQLTPHLFEAAGGNLAVIEPTVFPKAFSFCNALSKDTAADARSACYGGFGKEFTVLAQERDIRDIGKMNEESLQKVRTWCALAGDDAGETACNFSAQTSLYWGGEHSPDASFTFCKIAPEGIRAACYAQLTFQIDYYSQNEHAKELLCKRLPDEFRKKCGL